LVRTSCALLCAALVGVAFSAAPATPGIATESGPAGPPSTDSLIGVREVSSSELVRQVCDDPSESLVRFIDLDSDRAEEAVVSVSCGDSDLITTGIFSPAPEFPALVEILTGYNFAVDDGAPPRLTAVAPRSGVDDDREPSLLETTYALRNGRLQILTQRSLAFGEYLNAAFAPSTRALFDYDFNPHVAGNLDLLPRPYRVHLPSTYDPSMPSPLLIGLHGRGSFGVNHESKFFRFGKLANAKGWIYALPNGIVDPKGKRIWNATDACCNFYNVAVDDVAFISKLIDDVSALYNVDQQRIFVVGHSNGGFMAHRLACDLSDRITAVVSISGAQWFDPSNCNPTAAVRVLEIHSARDNIVSYNGGASGDLPPYPSAHQTVESWAALNGCDASPLNNRVKLDLAAGVPGRETRVQRFQNCPGGAVQLWTVQGAGHSLGPADHILQPGLDWPDAIFDFLADPGP
jgi:polyhydroxybutyrate depolymerase